MPRWDMGLACDTHAFRGAEAWITAGVHKSSGAEEAQRANHKTGTWIKT